VVAVSDTSQDEDESSRLANQSKAGRAPSVLIIVQNLPVPFDRRVWMECQALRRAGYHVTVVCPKGAGDPDEETIDGVQLFKYTPRSTGGGAISFFIEYAYSFLATLWLTCKAWRNRRFDVIQACNPPDIFWPIALTFRPFGVKFVFDHHDLCPELFESRFENGSKFLGRGLRWLERRTFKAAHHVISTNESYRDVALARGGKTMNDVTVVRTGPDPEKLRRCNPNPKWRAGRKYLVTYLGVMGPQDGVDLAVKCADHVVHGLGRTDTSFVFLGSGDCFEELINLRDDLRLSDFVTFTGRVSDDVLAEVLSTSDVGLCPDPKNALNDVSTMNKTMEYMAYNVPVVAFDLRETRVSASDSAIYATPNDVEDFADKVVELLDDELRRRDMGERGRQRVLEHLTWSRQSPSYLRVYDEVLVGARRPLMTVPPGA
jgi:glycosyltransferase involved in cell wall biosynthesis